MTERKQILDKALGRSWPNGEELLYRCPSCSHHKRKLSVNIDKNVFKCWVCGYSGTDISKLLRKSASMSLYQEWISASGGVDLSRYDQIFGNFKEEAPREVSLPECFKTLTGPVTPYTQKPTDYLLSRGFTKKDILKWRVGYCDYGEYQGRVIVPSFNRAGALNYFIARSYTGDDYKYKNPRVSKDIIFNDLNIDWNQDIILVEGVFDAMKCENAIPILGSSLKETSVLFEKICMRRPNIYMAFDLDAKDKESKIMSNLRSFGINTYSIDIHPYQDLGEMDAEEVKRRKCNAAFITNRDYLKYKINI